MRIDAHLHIGLNDWSERSLIENLDTRQIDKGWILTWDEMRPRVPGYYVPLDIREVEQAFRNHPDRLVPFYAPDPARKDWRELIERHLDSGFQGCGELKVPYRWSDPRIQALLEFLDERHLPLIFHMERARNIFVPARDKGLNNILKKIYNERFNGVSAHFMETLGKSNGPLQRFLHRHLVEFPGYLLDFMELEHALDRFKNVKFIGHGPHIWNHFSVPARDYLFHQKGSFQGEGIIWKLLENYDNFYCDISGYSGYNALDRDPGISKQFLEKHHNRILYGTDNLNKDVGDLISNLNISEEKLKHIFFRNALVITGD